MNKEIFDSISEMKFLYDCGADLNFLSSIYSLSKEKIQGICNDIDQHPELKNCMIKKYNLLDDFKENIDLEN